MKRAHKKQKLMVSALVGAIMIPGSALTAQAAESQTKEQAPTLPIAGIESVLEKCYETKVKENINLYMVPTQEGEYLNRAFSNIGAGDFIYVRSAPDETSDWTGKLYDDSTVTVLEYADDWTKIRSGEVEGYVPAAVLYTGEDARQRAADYEKEVATVEASVLNVRNGQGIEAEILTQVQWQEQYEVIGDEVNNWYPIRVGEIEGWVYGDYIQVETAWAYADSKEEDAKKTVETVQSDAVSISNGQAVIDFACQFIGNPYVWGGTSLTEGADCSGFVQSVYANFGIQLPRTTYDMEHVGNPVDLESALPGDLVLYDGHVGLYMGDGNIVNAMNEVDGIGICSATYAPILTIRRVL